MTDLLPARARNGRIITRPEIPECRGRHHTGTNEAWRRGCRCPSALEAHEQWKRDNGRRTYSRKPSLMGDDGVCRAPRHGSYLAWLDGCRCPESIAKRERKRELERSHRESRSLSGSEWWYHSKAVKRRTDGRLDRDPRWRWRHGKMATDGVIVGAMVAGWPIVGTPSVGDKVAAVARMEGRHVPFGPTRTRLITAAEIADVIGIHEREVHRLRRLRERLRSERTQRRLADRQWRDAIITTAIGRGRGR